MFAIFLEIRAKKKEQKKHLHHEVVWLMLPMLYKFYLDFALHNLLQDTLYVPRGCFFLSSSSFYILCKDSRDINWLPLSGFTVFAYIYVFTMS